MSQHWSKTAIHMEQEEEEQEEEEVGGYSVGEGGGQTIDFSGIDFLQ